jgi:hypothetical protein
MAQYNEKGDAHETAGTNSDNKTSDLTGIAHNAPIQI